MLIRTPFWWLDSVDEQPPPVEDEFPFQDEFSDPIVIDPRTLSVDRQLGRLVGIQRQVAALHAEQQALLAAINDGDASVDGWSSDLVSCALRIPPRQAGGCRLSWSPSSKPSC
jgi:hypothetical protein